MFQGTLKHALYPSEVNFPLYHGTSMELQRGDFIEPGHRGNFVRRMKHVYAADSIGGKGGVKGAGGYGKHLYEVRPTGPIGNRADARSEHGYYASEYPFQVIRRIR
jgi:hypothetical protein